MREDRGELLDVLADEQAAGAVATPRLVLVDATTEFEVDGCVVGLRRALGWDKGRLLTQDLDWDHLPTMGWTLDDQDGDAVLHESRESQLVPFDRARAREVGILEAGSDGLVAFRTPTIAACTAVLRLSDACFEANCELADGRRVVVLGESESGDLPDATWFVGLTTSKAARYRVLDQLGARG